MNLRTYFAFAFALVFLASCAQTLPQPSYTDQLAGWKSPVNADQQQRACSYIRSEIARMQNIAMVGSAQLAPMYAMNIQINARQNIAALQSKAAEYRCSAAFAERQAPTGIESCVATCKANTARTPEQCFDSCNK
jgi:hypothetical protein